MTSRICRHLFNKLKQKPDAVSAFLSGELSEETKELLAEYSVSASDSTELRIALVQDLNKLVKPDPKKSKKAKKQQQPLYDSGRFSGISLGEKTRQLLSENPKGTNLARLNRMLLAEAYPGVLVFQDGILGISDSFAAYLVTVGFVCFLIGRTSGAALFRKFSAHKILGLYGLMNVVVCLLVFLKLGWFSVVCVFLSYFFMSIMFPTVFALGIFGLGARSKKASAFIVMAIMGGAVLPKLMGHVADQYDMSRGFIVPMACFIAIALYGFLWPRLSGADSLHGVSTAKGH